MNKIKLRIKWSKKERDFVIHYPTKATGSFISQLIQPWRYLTLNSTTPSRNEKEYYADSSNNYVIKEMDWIKELVDRGYDKTTLKFEISINVDQLREKFPHIYNDLTEPEKKRLGID